jgi:hypothetical protein
MIDMAGRRISTRHRLASSEKPLLSLCNLKETFLFAAHRPSSLRTDTTSSIAFVQAVELRHLSVVRQTAVALLQASEEESIVLLKFDRLALHGAGAYAELDFVTHRIFQVVGVR